ncbi:MAG: imidazolonepropionase [Candidatus Poseidoniales archaeon]
MAQEESRHIFVNAGPIAHFSTGDLSKPLVGLEMSSDEQIHPTGWGFVIESGRFSAISPSDEVLSEFGHNSVVHDLSGRAIIPGFVDAHTHLLWDGDRSKEMRMRQQGMSYAEIAAAGGGIRYTVTQTRGSDNLLDIGRSRMQTAIGHGTTSIEVKSGYGLDTESELKLLQLYSDLQKESEQLRMSLTWMGAHDIPHGLKRSEYVEQILSEQLPAVIEQGIATSADVFCEPGWFTLEDTEEICKEAKRAGLSIRLHVDEFANGDGLELAAELGAVTADHAIHSSDDARASASEAGTLQGFLPGTPYVMGSEHWPPIQKCIDEEWPWTLATDFNPNCQSLSIPMTGSLVAHRLKIDPIAALAAATRNPATAFETESECLQGVITVGAVANFSQLKSESVESWCQSPGHSPILKTWCL